MSADLGKRLTELRKNNQMTKEDLARKMSVKPKDVEKWEDGKDSPDGDQLIKLSQIYKMPIDEILLNFDTDGAFEQPKAQAQPVANHPANTNSAQNVKSFNWYAFPYPIFVVLVYFCIGFWFDVWHPTWLIILTIPIYYMMIAMLKTNNWYAFPYPILAVFVYLVMGFLFDAWHPAWLIILTIPIYYIFVAMNRAKGFKAKANIFPYPILCVIFYLAVGFDYNLWHPMWMIFLTIPVYYMIVNMIKSQ